MASRGERLKRDTPEERAKNTVFHFLDFDPDFESTMDAGDVASYFEGLLMEGVVEQIQQIRNTMEQSLKLGRDPLEFVGLNFLFLGSSGTGKITVAHRMGKMFHEMGLIPSDSFVSCNVSDLVAGYVGQTARKVQKKFEEAVGGVLFVDEAYGLDTSHQGSYNQEAVNQMVALLTHPDYQSNMLVILAGYEGEMKAFLRSNLGLQSRFSDQLHFRDLTKFECVCLVRVCMLL